MNITEKIQQFFETSESQKKQESNCRIILTYSGTLIEDKVYQLGEDIEQYLRGKNVKKSLIKKIFFTAVESMQNIRKHGLKDMDGTTPGAIIFNEDEHAFHTSFISAINNTLVDPLYKGLDFVNTLDKAQLKQHYRKILNNGVMSENGGAGLGLISIGLKCDGKIGTEKISFGDSVSVIRLFYKMDKV